MGEYRSSATRGRGSGRLVRLVKALRRRGRPGSRRVRRDLVVEAGGLRRPERALAAVEVGRRRERLALAAERSGRAGGRKGAASQGISEG